MDAIKQSRMMIPNIFTAMNLIGGFMAVWQILEGHGLIASWLIITAIMFDMADGKLARLFGSESAFGFQLDSMADLVTSGIAPSIMILQFAPLSAWIRVPLATLFLLASAYRLARFNILDQDKRHSLFLGLPVPVATLTVVGLLFFRFLPQWLIPYFWGGTVLSVSILMVSRIPYRWPRVYFNQGVGGSVASVIRLLLTAGMLFFPSIFILPCFFAYIGHGAIKHLMTSSEE